MLSVQSQRPPLSEKEYQKYDKNLKQIASPHTSSFDWSLSVGLKNLGSMLGQFQVKDNQGNILEFWYGSLSMDKPKVPTSGAMAGKDHRLYPWECKVAGTTYSATMNATIHMRVKHSDGSKSPIYAIQKNLGQYPVMIKSKLCNLYNASPKELVEHKEEPYDFGGYFVVNGGSRLIRMLIANRRNLPLALERDTFTSEPGCTNMGIFIRCIGKNEIPTTNSLIYKLNGTMVYAIQSRTYLIPVILLLKALKFVSDKELFDTILAPSKEQVDGERLSLSLLEAKRQYGCKTRKDALTLIGSFFRNKFTHKFLDSPDDEIGEYILSRFVLPHLEKNEDKFNFLIFMIQKLLKLVNKEIDKDDIDSLAMQEACLPGQIYLAVLKAALYGHAMMIAKRLKVCLDMNGSQKLSLSKPEQISQTISSVSPSAAQSAVNAFLATGNAPRLSGIEQLEIPQYIGLTVMAENINYLRYLSHFTSIHRGSFFQQQRVTTVRKLRSEQWGFICPVHTPDGEPCGLLNHLSSTCTIAPHTELHENLFEILVSLGMSPLQTYTTKNAPIFYNGRLLGCISLDELSTLANKLRFMKSSDEYPQVPSDIEVVHIPHNPKIFPRIIPMLYISSEASRFRRNVKNLMSNHIESIGPYEQLFLTVAVTKADYKPNTTHIETTPTAILSHVANLTPFSHFNQSPRNVYQCQMAKQTIGIPLLAYQQLSGNKIYRLQTPQLPISKTRYQNEQLPYNTYLTGTNAVVAVLSYTGYDMEDAMILNKSSYDRGMAQAATYKTFDISLSEEQESQPLQYLSKSGIIKDTSVNLSGIDKDGLPKIGYFLTKGSPFYCYFDAITEQMNVEKYKHTEDGYVDSVKVISKCDHDKIIKAKVVVRYDRRPVIGDKFSSRHGQKGILSMLWPQEDMPFTESGMSPDIIINPHAFPSRMTIGMLVESMASKCGSLHGYYPDATTFNFDEKNKATDYFGQQLLKAGYNYYGNEVMYSGTLGVEFKADIFIGVVYYQRLRHMVLDKYQVRSNGPVNRLTHQPVKGRKIGGGIRVGEMERDGLLSYGASHVLRDRLFHSSDEDFSYVCTNCGDILGVSKKAMSNRQSDFICRLCKTGKHVQLIEMPYVFKYLTNELAAMNINVKLNVGEVS